MYMYVYSMDKIRSVGFLVYLVSHHYIMDHMNGVSCTILV